MIDCFSEARNLCARRNATLPTPHNEADWKTLVEFVNKYEKKCNENYFYQATFHLGIRKSYGQKSSHWTGFSFSLINLHKFFVQMRHHGTLYRSQNGRKRAPNSLWKIMYFYGQLSYRSTEARMKN